jgi:hypothetical protein
MNLLITLPKGVGVMSDLIGLLVLLAVSVLLGKMLFDKSSPGVRKATEPAMANVIWQIALIASSMIYFSGLAVQGNVDGPLIMANFVWILVSFGILLFSSVAMVRTLKGRSESIN